VKNRDEDSSLPTSFVAPAWWSATLRWRRRRQSLQNYTKFKKICSS